MSNDEINDMINAMAKDIEKKDKAIENIIQCCLLHKSFSTLVCRDISTNKCNTYRKNGGCNKCIKDYFLAKVEEENE